MKNLRRLGVSVTLTCILAVVAFAGETQGPPCAPPEPGITNTPPCAAAQIMPGDSLAPGEMSASNAAVTPSVTEVAIDLLQSVLLLF